MGVPIGTETTAIDRSNRAALTLLNADELEHERHLIERVRAGDREAFGGLVERHIQRALAVGYRVLRHREDAEDLVQDAFLSALQHIDEFQSDRPFWPWFSRILVNRGLDLVASRSVRATSDLPPDAADRGASPAVVVERKEITERFRAALADMPPRQRLVVQLFELDGYSVGEIANMLGSSPVTVRWHLHMSRRQLRKAMSAFQED